MSVWLRAYANAPLLLVAGALGWAGNTIAGRLAAGEISPMMLILLRWGLVVVLLSVFAFGQVRQALPAARGRCGWLLYMGGSISLFNGFLYWSANFTTAINIGILQGTMPALIILGMFLFFGARVNRYQLLGLLMTLFGVLFVVSRGDVAVVLALSFNPGDLLMLFGCLFYVSYTLGLESRPPINAFVIMWFIAVASFLTSVPLALVEWWLGYLIFPGVKGWLLLLYIVIVPSFLSQVFFVRGVDLIGASRAGLYINLVPIFAAMLGVLLLGEAPHGFHLFALILVFTGIYLFEKSRPKP